uniref:Uncharacterized protein n=1 Tax=Magnetospirillum gryphiswaldense TaxID=55518 RepID=A4TXJ2_9PROT|nr:hypothetical protein MGR_2434 [Magnetospirillum gryphiswaldense MSR-1]
MLLEVFTLSSGADPHPLPMRALLRQLCITTSHNDILAHEEHSHPVLWYRLIKSECIFVTIWSIFGTE